ncbi:hypothetical protein N8482_02570, partial [Chitinophagales bacterium]|nr:hypothetical protein [Chitinophagales bacterium]
RIAKEYLSGQASYSVLAEENNLANKSVVREFVKWYRRQLALNSSKEIELKQPEKPEEIRSANLSDIEKEKELEALRKQLVLSELKCEMLETMIDQAERTLSIDIRKKSGTNQ